ncbi:GntR family transcriptional regulator [Thiofilum flexile]|uniref:GntR family transcriptional regulator n=1 Tax=Thiofilum flexile TaxID=125627 RepID=UPI00037B304C|nr:GntR family transcriptional regulator [Thiofilum flexile]
MSLNTRSPIPLYQQLAERIRQDVAASVYAVDTKIPSEHELASYYGIGRPTVRQATDLLVREGLLQRRRGSGTYVLPPVQQLDLFSLAGTSAALAGSQARITLLQPPRLLALDEPHPVIFTGRRAYYFQRLSSLAAEPVLLETFYLDAELFYGLEQHNLEGDSLARLVRETYYLEASEAEQSFSIIYPEPSIGILLKTNRHTPLLQVGRTLHFGSHRAAIYCDIHCRTDRFHFSQTIHLPATAGWIRPAQGTTA